MNKWELLKAYVDGMYSSAEVMGDKSIQKTLAKIIAQMDKFEKEEKESASQTEVPAE